MTRADTPSALARGEPLDAVDPHVEPKLELAVGIVLREVICDLRLAKSA